VQRIHVQELAGHVGERVRVAGWLHHQRRLSKLTFLLVRDRSGTVQAIVEEPTAIAELAELHSETVLEIDGVVVAADQAPGGVELHEPELLRLHRDHFDVMSVLRDVVAGMLEAMRKGASPAVEQLGVELPTVPAEIPWVHFSETGVDDVDLAPADERRLGEEYGELVFVTGYPMAKRPFYTHPEPGRPEYSNSFDLISGGSSS
jgi:aspartyl/asparaginyl-tRNA synthetase